MRSTCPDSFPRWWDVSHVGSSDHLWDFFEESNLLFWKSRPSYLSYHHTCSFCNFLKNAIFCFGELSHPTMSDHHVLKDGIFCFGQLSDLDIHIEQKPYSINITFNQINSIVFYQIDSFVKMDLHIKDLNPQFEAARRFCFRCRYPKHISQYDVGDMPVQRKYVICQGCQEEMGKETHRTCSTCLLVKESNEFFTHAKNARCKSCCEDKIKARPLSPGSYPLNSRECAGCKLILSNLVFPKAEAKRARCRRCIDLNIPSKRQYGRNGRTANVLEKR